MHLKVPSTKDGIKEQLESYLKNPPVGIDPLLWDQAKKDNPDPDQLIPGQYFDIPISWSLSGINDGALLFAIHSRIHGSTYSITHCGLIIADILYRIF